MILDAAQRLDEPQRDAHGVVTARIDEEMPDGEIDAAPWSLHATVGRSPREPEKERVANEPG